MGTIAIIADDLTGAADTGVQFCPYFRQTVLLSDEQLGTDFAEHCDPSSRALAIFTNSRALNIGQARAQLRRAAAALAAIFRPHWVYKKIDSCLRGNIGVETEALMDALGYGVSFIAPAFPAMGRTTVDDIHLINGIPVAQTEIARDPVTPVTESCLSRVVAAQCRLPVAHVDLPFLDGDERQLRGEVDRLIRQGAKHLVFDAVIPEHLDKIARTALFSSAKIIPVGSAGLADSLGRHLPEKSSPAPEELRVEGRGRGLLVCGTTSEVTKRQIETLREKYSYEVLTLSPHLLAETKQRDDLQVRARSTQSVLAHNNLIVRIGLSPEESAAIAKTFRRQHPQAVAAGLGYFVAELLHGRQPVRLFLTGGDTAYAVLSVLGAQAVRLSGEIAPGMVRGTIMGGVMDGWPVVTKAGAFGKNDTLVVLHESWSQRIDD
ncbi:MAG: four-carbon acid sugar kinase family protein [Desulfobacterales bacterium]|nr:MAG: four-carbon acid sugar kinase family protein [Desulfobacterales bacterium]